MLCVYDIVLYPLLACLQGAQRCLRQLATSWMVRRGRVLPKPCMSPPPHLPAIGVAEDVLQGLSSVKHCATVVLKLRSLDHGISTTRELVRSADSQTHPRPAELEALHLNKPSRGFWCMIKFESHRNRGSD